MSIHKASVKGKRPQNEDKHSCVLNMDTGSTDHDKTKAPINYFAVYDGHGSKFISAYLAEHLPTCFMDKRIQYPLKKNFVKKLYNYWQNELKTKYAKIAENAGSTCCAVIQYREGDCEYLNVLNTGDSRCIICRGNLGIPLTYDHKPGTAVERARITALGGTVTWDGFDWRVDSLSVSRAFGDISSEPFLTCMPDIYKYKLTKDDKFIVLACDGLFDVKNTAEVVEYVLENCYDMQTGMRINKNINIAKRLADHAIAIGSTDNVSVIVVFFD